MHKTQLIVKTSWLQKHTSAEGAAKTASENSDDKQTDVLVGTNNGKSLPSSKTRLAASFLLSDTAAVTVAGTVRLCPSVMPKLTPKWHGSPMTYFSTPRYLLQSTQCITQVQVQFQPQSPGTPKCRYFNIQTLLLTT